MKRGRSPSPPSDPSWQTRMVQLFRAVDTAIMTTRMSRKMAFVANILEPVEKLSGLRFKMDDFERLISVCPSAFRLEWAPFTECRGRSAPVQSHRLCIGIADSWPNEHASTRVSVTQRVESFRSTVNRIKNESDIPSRSIIPKKPINLDANNSTSAVVANVAAEAQAAKESEAKLLQSEVDSSTNKIEALKAAVLMRNAAKSVAVERESALKAREVRLLRLQALPAFCDLLRMMFNRRRKTVISTSECIRTLVAETKVSAEEYKWRIYSVCEIVPDFITIISPDDISPVEYLKVNVYCNYEDCTKRLLSYIEKAQ